MALLVVMGVSAAQVMASSPSPLKVEVAVKPTRLLPGEQLRFRIEDHGKSQVSYGEKFVVQEEVEGGSWIPASFTPRGAWSAVLHALLPGSVSNWIVLQIPAEASVGEYRIKKEVKTEGHRRFLVGAFRVGETS